MKTHSILLMGLALLGSQLLSAQNPVRDLKAEVNMNRYVKLSWEAPLKEGETIQQSEVASTYNFWKLVKIPAQYNHALPIGDQFLYSREVRPGYKDTIPGHAYFGYLDSELNVVSETEVTYNNRYSPSGSMTLVGDDIYAVRAARSYVDTIFKYNRFTFEEEYAFQITKKYGFKALAYVPELDGGNGGFAELGNDTVYFRKMNGDALVDKTLRLKDIPLPEKTETNTNPKIETLTIAYYNKSYYILGYNGTKKGSRSKVPFVWQFDENGNYVKQVIDMTEFTDEYYMSPKRTSVNVDPVTGNTYLVVDVQQIEEDYIHVMYYYELAVNNDVMGYDVFRNDTELTSDDFKELEFADTLMNAGSYDYKVRAVYSGNRVSEFQVANVQIEEIGECQAPANLKANVTNKNNVVLDWEKPVMEGRQVVDYTVYRDGEKIGTCSYSQFVDHDLAVGDHNYTVSARYDNSGEAQSQALTVHVDGTMDRMEPRELSGVSYINEAGEGCVDLKWEAPLFGPDVNMSYSEMKDNGKPIANASGMGIKYNKGELNHLKNYVLDSVSFIAGGSGRYRIVVYEDKKSVCQQTLDSLAVNFNGMNQFALEKPILIQPDKEYLIGVVARPDRVDGVENICVSADDSYAPAKEGSMSALWIFRDYAYEYESFINRGNETGNYNIEAHFTALNNVGLTEEGTPFQGYAIYRNGTKLPDAVQELNYTDKALEDGDYTYTIASVWNGSEDLQSAPVAKNVTTLCGAPDNLGVTVEEDDVTLNWNAPLTGAPMVKRWDTGKNKAKLGNKGGSDLYLATLFTVEDLKSLQDFSITHIEFFPAERATFTLQVYSGEELVYNRELSDKEYTLGEFNNIELEQPLLIDTTRDLRVGYKIVNYFNNGRPCGVDASTSADGKGNQLSADGKVWASASEQGIDNNWNIAFTVRYLNNKEVEPMKVQNLVSDEAVAAAPVQLQLAPVAMEKDSKLSKNELQGYNIYRNDVKVNAEPVADLTYVDHITETNHYAYYIGAVYSESAEMFSNIVTVDVTGIHSASVDEVIELYPNPVVTELHINGAYDSYQLFDMNGRVVKTSETEVRVIDMTDLAAGEYLLVIQQGNDQLTRKVLVR